MIYCAIKFELKINKKAQTQFSITGFQHYYFPALNTLVSTQPLPQSSCSKAVQISG